MRPLNYNPKIQYCAADRRKIDEMTQLVYRLRKRVDANSRSLYQHEQDKMFLHFALQKQAYLRERIRQKYLKLDEC